MTARLPVRLSPRPVAALRRRVRSSAVAGHVRSSVRAAFWPTSIGSGVVVALVVLTWLQSLTPITGGIR